MADRVLKRGVKGDDVKKLQSELNRNKYSVDRNLVVDGSFGPATEEVVKFYQKMNGLAVDGSVGPITRASMIKSSFKL